MSCWFKSFAWTHFSYHFGVHLHDETDVGPPCAPWCTTHFSGAQHRSTVHNIALYSLGGAQRRSHKPNGDKFWIVYDLFVFCSQGSVIELSPPVSYTVIPLIGVHFWNAWGARCNLHHCLTHICPLVHICLFLGINGLILSRDTT